MIGLEHISTYLGKMQVGMTTHIVCSGGACSVIYLKNRSTTHDIDFFTPNVEVIEAVMEAKEKAPDYIKDTWPSDWINAEMIAFVSNRPGCETLYQNSIDCEVILFKSDSLVVYAADWRYQLVGKIVRAYQISQLSGTHQAEERTGKDLSDAVSIMRHLISRHGRPLLKVELLTWYADGPTLEDAEIAYVNTEYKHLNGMVGIV